MCNRSGIYYKIITNKSIIYAVYTCNNFGKKVEFVKHLQYASGKGAKYL